MFVNGKTLPENILRHMEDLHRRMRWSTARAKGNLALTFLDRERGTYTYNVEACVPLLLVHPIISINVLAHSIICLSCIIRSFDCIDISVQLSGIDHMLTTVNIGSFQVHAKPPKTHV